MTTIKILFLFLVSLSAFSQNTVVAEVDGMKITADEYKRAFDESIMFVTNKVVTRESVLDNLIHKKLGVQKAKKNNLDEDPIVKEKLNDVLFNAQISKDLEGKLQKIEVKESDIKNYYKTHPEYRTAHILLRVRAKPSTAELKAALDQTKKIYQELLKKPEMFAELANRYSQASTGPNGGDMGFQPAVRLAPEYYNAVKGKKPDTIIPPVRTQFGFHIIKVLAVKEFDEINQPLYKKIVYDQKRDEILESYFKELKKNKKIVVNQQALSKLELSRKEDN